MYSRNNKINRSQFIFAFWMCAIGVVGVGGFAWASDPFVRKAQDPVSEACPRCHTWEKTQLSHNKLAWKKKACLTCHADNVQSEHSTSGTSKLKEKIRGKPPLRVAQESALNREAPRKRLSITDGMKFPMYYQGTRLGEEPNKMVLIPAGKFIMGTNERLPDEGPEHNVTIGSYYIDIYEVTNIQYKKFNNATKRRSPSHFRNRSFPEGKADHPVTFVTWEDANAYCNWAGKRLPTDQEWEKAARGTDGRMFPWGNEFSELKANSPLRWKQIGLFGDTSPAGAFVDGVSPYGLYDTSGNVWEWTASWYKAYPNNKTESESYGERYKTLKGGSWFDCSFYNCGISAPVFNRAFFAKKVKNDSFGFRCAKNVESDKK